MRIHVFLRCFTCLLLLALSAPAAASSLSDALAKYPPSAYGIIYGDIDGGRISAPLDWVGLKKYPVESHGLFSGTNDTEKNVTVSSYFFAFVKPGNYFMNVFNMKLYGGGRSSNLSTSYKEPKDATSPALRHAVTGSLSYWGSIYLEQTKASTMFSHSEYAVHPLEISNRRELLGYLKMEARGTAWENIVNSQLGSPKAAPVASSPATPPGIGGSSAPATPPSSGVVQYNGFYFESSRPSNFTIYSYYRFFADGSVTAYISTDQESSGEIFAKLASAPFGRGNYSIENDVAKFSLTYPKGKVDYTASPDGDKLSMKFHSYIINTDGVSSCRFLPVN